ncbi:MAG TPA: DUF2231 domain-containing protein [Gemmatimonadales bacterium]|nr:DUF2231 domain-containing protein [Gemmatimonadales bacterium]
MFGYDWPRVHAFLTALPVALLSLAVLMELVSLVLKKESLRRTGLLLLVIGALGAAAAVGAGLKAEGIIDHGPALHEVMEEHEELALTTLGIFAVLTIWRLARERRMGTSERTLAVVVGLVGLAFLVNTGHHGGELVFEHAAGVSNATLQAELANRLQGHQHGGGTADGHPEEHDDHHGDEPAHEHADSATHGHGSATHNHDGATTDGHSHSLDAAAHQD